MLARRRLFAAALAVTAVALAGCDSSGETSERQPSRAHRLVEASPADSPGAAALLDPANRDVDWSAIDSVKAVRPLPKDAKSDRPSFYDDDSGCQVKQGNPVPKVCPSGDQRADKTLMLVGDSKIGQWQTAFSDLGEREGWRVLTSTKSGCAFTDAAMTGGSAVLTDCRQWGRSTLRDILAAKPDVVVTSQVHDTALPVGKTSPRDRTTGAMIGGLQRYWKRLQAAGIRVVVMLDNPMPTSHPTYQCVEDHPDDLTTCAFSLAGPRARSSAPMQLEAAATTPGVGVVDMTPTYCPGETVCPAVIGNVLIYRAGSHLTKAFVVSAERQLSRQLFRATAGTFGRR
ncbi:MAG: hypothetical protein JWP31_907 [Aeromicrobium sp.]|nr:hypothetical protein [Aeromicrobium sp.]